MTSRRGSRDQPDYAAIVVGSGSAGLYTALQAVASGRVALVTKGSTGDSNTAWAQGGMAAAMDAGDSPEQHLADTIKAGAGIVDEEAARILCEEAPGRIARLSAIGVGFDRDDGHIALGREAAHSGRRIVHAGGDRTGAELVRGLAAAVSRGAIETFESTRCLELLQKEATVRGIRALGPGGEMEMTADAVVLATGGAGQLYANTTNPPGATGDGIALAFAAGAELADMEFVQFHPTAFRKDGFEAFLISEAVRGEGAWLLNGAGERFMPRYHESAELAPRDVVARAIFDEMQREGSDHVVLDGTRITHVDFRVRFPGISAFCERAGIDPRHEPIPVAPAAHYLMGGIRTDTWGRTTLPGLYAVGECACTGVHGANRLASNSLMETVVFAERAAESIAEGVPQALAPAHDAILVRGTGLDLPAAELRQAAWDTAGIVRDGASMAALLDRRRAAAEVDCGEQDPEEHSMQVLGEIVLEAALRREESRGAHFRRDYPQRDDTRWKRRQVIRRDG